MPLLAFVTGEVCDRKFPVSLEAKRSPEKLEMELPHGWTVHWQRDKETWKYVWVVRCPEHPPRSS
jgi:hypothetical protein